MEGSVERLQSLLGSEKVSTNLSIREQHGRDENFPELRPPLAVIYPANKEDIQATLSWCRTENISLIAFGAGTSFEGSVLSADPLAPAVSLDLTKMNQVVSIQPENFLAVVQPGITRKTLNEALRYTGLFFPVDPGADASLGGMASTNASGTTTVRYGGMRQNTVALEVVLANGEILRLGRAVRKTSSGYDLKDLFIGSTGTLGIITELTLQLHPVPEHVCSLRVFFPSIQHASQAAYTIMANALPVARIELVDAFGIQCINRYLKRSYQEQPALFMEFHASSANGIEEEIRLAEECVREAGALDIDVARSQKDQKEQWEARHNHYWAFVNAHPDRRYTITDTAVPLVHLPEIIAYGQQMLEDLELPGSIVGHVGDGNFHTVIASTPEDKERIHMFSAQLVRRALALGGTASGEHGIGLLKREYMPEEHGPALDWMRQLKTLFDPGNILNPGKII